MKKSTAIYSALGAIGAFAAGAVASAFALKGIVKKETGKSLEEILEENKDVAEIISAVEVAAEAAPEIGDTVEAIQKANAEKEADVAAEETAVEEPEGKEADK